MNKKVKYVVQTVFFVLVALLIPGLLMFQSVHGGKYRKLKNEVIDLERTQEKLIEENKKLITEIGVLSSSDRIESIAENELGMRKAETEEIVRVEMKGRNR